MDTRVGVGKSLGNGVHAGVSTGAGGLLRAGFLLILVLPWAFWIVTGFSLAKNILGALLEIDGCHFDTETAELHLVCFAVTAVEALIYFSI